MDWRSILVGALALLLLVQVGRLVWIFVSPGKPAPDRPAYAKIDMGVLTRFDPFFAAGQAAEIATSASGNYTLYGLSADGSGGGSAIIGLQDGTQVSVAVGEALSTGGMLKTVHPDHIVILENGQLLRVGFLDEAVAMTQSPDEQNLAAAEDSSDEPAQANIVDPAKLLLEAGLRPSMDGLSLKGLEVTASGEAPALAASGLQAGDIILSVNGTALNTPAALNTLRQRLANAASAEVSIERGGQRRMITLRTR